MESPIVQRQNEPGSLQKLKAMRYFYSQAKRIRALRVSVTVGLAVCGLVLGRVNQAQQYLALLAWWTIMDQVVGAALEERSVQLAASIQEEFDLHVLDILRNPRIPSPLPEEIFAGETRFRGDSSKLIDWYGPSIPEEFGVLLCLRSNMAWDSRLRRTYGWLLVCVSAAWVVTVVATGLVTGSTVADLLLILAPSLPLVVQNANTARVHFDLAASKETLVDELSSTWRAAIRGQTPPSPYAVRLLQDGIYAQRTANALVPDAVYSYLRRFYNDYMIRTLQHFEEEVAAAKSSNPAP